MEIENPVLWSAEDPQLYDLTIQVYDRAGKLQEYIPERVGFRRFEMKDRIMTLNGKRIVFKGVNRHEFSSVTGRHVSEEELIKDLKTMKQNNINAIRTCHYPDASLIYRLCDEYGLYMIDETNLESHGSWDTVEASGDFSGVVPCDRPEWLDMMLDRANSMYQRDKNHPAILIWSCGNESFGGKTFLKCLSSSAEKILPVWSIMKEFSMTGDTTTPAIWKARCILLWRTLKNSWKKTGANLLSAANILTPWEIPAGLCINTRI